MVPEEYEALLQHIAATNTLPADTTWAATLPVLQQLTRHALDLAATSHNSATVDHATFVAENAYLLEQLELMREPPFTLQRLCEVLLNPSQFHTRVRSPDVLRGEVLQSTIRKCVLV